MLGVDFVISALFDTSGLRPDGDCASELPGASNTITIRKTSAGFTRAIVMSNGKAAKGYHVFAPSLALHFSCCPASDTLRTAKRLQRSIVIASVALLQFLEQLLLQMAARCLFDCASLCHYRFFLHLAFSSCSWFGGLRQVLYLRPIRAHFSLFWFCVRIH